MFQKLKKQKSNRGITLVSLIITITIMLILAATTYTILVRTGIIENAENAKLGVLNQVDKAQNKLDEIMAEDRSHTGGTSGDSDEEGDIEDSQKQKVMELIINPNGGEWGINHNAETLISLSQEQIKKKEFERTMTSPDKTPIYQVKFDTGIKEYNIDSETVNTTFNGWEREYGLGTISYENKNWVFHFPSDDKGEGVEGTTKVKAVYKGIGITLPDIVRDRVGYEFIGWSESPDGKIEILNPGDTYNTEENITLYAIWSAKTVKVDFDAGEGDNISISENTRFVKYGGTYSETYDQLGNNSKIKSLPKPTRYGYDFIGWDLEKGVFTEITTPVDDDTFVTNENTHTLYAKWKEKEVEKISLEPSNLFVIEGSENARIISKTIEPADALDQRLNWRTSNSSIATVDQNGKITGITPGTAIITASSVKNPSVTATCTVTVLNKIEIGWNEIVIGDSATLTVENIAQSGQYQFEWYKNDTNATTGGTKIGTTAGTQFGITPVEVYDNEGKYIYCKMVDTDGNEIQTSEKGKQIEINYTITTATHLNNLASLVNSGRNLSGKTVTVGNDINLNGNDQSQWTPMTSFSGTIDGGGKTVRGVHINKTGSYQAFIKSNHGTIKNLVLEGNIRGGSYSAGFISDNYGTVENCINNINVTSQGNVSGGMLARPRQNSTIKKCINNGSVTATGRYVGGIAGDSEYTDAKNISIIECINNGNVTANGVVGGIIGDVSSTIAINKCVNNANITGNDNVGGIAGRNRGNSIISECYNTGKIQSTTSAGGIVGTNGNILSNMSSQTFDKATIENCYNLGEVEATGKYVGGIAGNNSYVAGTKDSVKILNSYNVGKVSQGTSHGAILGANKGTVDNCYYASDLLENGIGTAKPIEEMNSLRFASLLNKKNDVINKDASPFRMITEQDTPVLSWQEGTLDEEKPTIESASGKIDTIFIKAKDNTGIVAYGLASNASGSENQTYTRFITESQPGETIDLQIKTEEAGTYYVWVEDAAGNKTVNPTGIKTEVFQKPVIKEVLTPTIGEELTLEVQNPQNNVTYEWHKEGNSIAIGTGTTLKISRTEVVNDEEKEYYVAARVNSDEKQSEPVSWKVNYTISKKEHITGIAEIVNSGTTLVGKEVKIDSNISSIDMKNETFSGIGNSVYGFAGTFNGNGKTIENIMIQTSETQGGLFIILPQTGIIHDLVIKGTVKGNTDVGGLVGKNQGGTIKNVGSDMTVTTFVTNANIGGIVGYNQYGTIENSYFNGTAEATGASAKLGGIVGNTSGGYIRNVYHAGKVINNYAGTNANTGGIIGYANNNALLNHSYVVGTVTSKTNGSAVVGYTDNAGNFSNNYYADTVGATNTYTGITQKNIAEMNSIRFAQTLNSSAYKMIIEQDYPALSWQTGTLDTKIPVITSVQLLPGELKIFIKATDEQGIVIYGLKNLKGEEVETTYILKENPIETEITIPEAGKYDIFVEDAAGNQAIATINAMVQPQISITNDMPGIGETTTLKVDNVFVGTTYVWYREGEILPVGEGETLTISESDVVNYGAYEYEGTQYEGKKYYCLATINDSDETMESNHIGWTTTYGIKTEEQMRGIATIVNSGNNLVGKTMWLENTITLTQNWTAIGNQVAANQFAGTFDGKYCEIKDLSIQNTANDNQGLFGYIGSNGTIRNLIVTGTISLTTRSNVGGIAGYNAGTIENCKVNITLTASNYVGGIAGYSTGVIKTSLTSNSSHIIAKSSNANLGGIVGRSDDGQIVSCYNAGIVTSDNTTTSVIMGGISGYNRLATIENSYHIGKMEVNGTTREDRVGGVAGYVELVDNIKNSYYVENTVATNTYGFKKKEEEMNSLRFANLLNGDNSLVNGTGTFKIITEQDYPALFWESGTLDEIVPKITSATVEKNIIKFSATDNTGIVVYGLALDSNETEVTNYTIYRTESTSLSQVEIAVPETDYGKSYYVWVEDAAGNKIIYKKALIPSSVEVPILEIESETGTQNPIIGEKLAIHVQNSQPDFTYTWYRDDEEVATTTSSSPDLLISPSDVSYYEGAEYYCIAKVNGTNIIKESANISWTVNYTFTSEEHLRGIAAIVNGTEFDGLANEARDLTGKTITMGNDIDFTIDIEPIGTDEHCFAGIFEGQNHTIINKKERKLGNVDLFGVINKYGQIYDLKIESYRYRWYGSIVKTNYGHIENCEVYNYAPETGENQQKLNYNFEFGGINYENRGHITRCSVEIIGDNSGKPVYAAYTKAIAKYGGISLYNYGLIDKCASTGFMGNNAGGIAYYNYGKIKESYNEAHGDTLGGMLAGIAVYTYGGSEISDCYNIGNLSGNQTDYEYFGCEIVGGIVGYRTVGNYNGITIKNVYNIGKIVGYYAGEIVGFGESNEELEIENCYSATIDSHVEHLHNYQPPFNYLDISQTNSLRFASLLNGSTKVETDEDYEKYNMKDMQNLPLEQSPVSNELSRPFKMIKTQTTPALYWQEDERDTGDPQITDIAVKKRIITLSATDDAGIVVYGLASDSAGTEVSTYTKHITRSTSISLINIEVAEADLDKNYYVWVEDAAGNKVVSQTALTPTHLAKPELKLETKTGTEKPIIGETLTIHVQNPEENATYTWYRYEGSYFTKIAETKSDSPDLTISSSDVSYYEGEKYNCAVRLSGTGKFSDKVSWTVDDTITDETHLQGIAAIVNGTEFDGLANEARDLTGKTITMGNDIDLNGSANNQWTPIGIDTIAFAGTFDGNEKTISGLYIDNNNSFSNYGALFGTNTGTIQNLTVRGTIEGVGRAGIAAINDGTIMNCVNETSVNSGIDAVGGIAGENNNLIQNCMNKGTISGRDGVGGIAGKNNDTISSSSNTGTIKSRVGTGGIAGDNYGLIEECYNKGNLYGGGEIGGIVGYFAQGTIDKCYNISNISSDEIMNIGGIAGYVETGTIKNSYNTQQIIGVKTSGQIVGTINGTLTSENNYYNSAYPEGTATGAIGITLNEMNSLRFASILNEKTSYQTPLKLSGAINNTSGLPFKMIVSQKYPALTWQTGTLDTEKPKIQSVKAEKNVISLVATDDHGIVAYGLASDSSGTEIEQYTMYREQSTSMDIDIETEYGETYYVWVEDAAGNKTVSSAIKIPQIVDNKIILDTESTTYTLTAKARLETSTNVSYYTVSLYQSDAKTLVDEYECSSNFTTEQSFTFSNLKPHTLYWICVDAYVTVGDDLYAETNILTAPPIPTLNLPIVEKEATWDNAGGDPDYISIYDYLGNTIDDVVYEFQLNNETWENCITWSTSSDCSTLIEKEGKYSIKVRGKDEDGNYSDDSEVYYRRIDATAPTISSITAKTASGANYTEGNKVAEDVNITMNATDKLSGIAGYEYSIGDQTNWQESTSNVITISDTNNTVYFRVVDYAGNRSDVKSFAVNNNALAVPTFSVSSINPVVGSSVTLIVTNYQPGITYKWYRSGNSAEPFATTTAQTITIDAANVVDWDKNLFYCKAVVGSAEKQSLTKQAITVNYTITTAQDLKNIASLVNSGCNLSGKTITVGASFSLSGTSTSQWTPIGTLSAPFEGTFDGNNKTLSGLYIDNTSDYQGLFGYVGSGGIIQNLTVSGTKVSASDYVGGLAGYNAGTITNCKNTVPVTGVDSIEGRAAGIAGFNSGTITGSSNTATISSTRADYYGGGIAGENTGNIESCYNTAQITTTDLGVSYAPYLGGISGYNHAGAIKNCYNTGAIQPISGSDLCVGGIVGYNFNATIEGSYNIGSVTGLEYSNAGGIAGYNSGGSITNGYNIGTITADTSGYAGGIVGYNNNNGTIKNTYNRANVTGNSKNKGRIVGYTNTTSTTYLSNNYYLSGISGTNTTSGTAKTANEMNSLRFASLLNGITFSPNTNTQAETFRMITSQKYPALSWQTGSLDSTAPTITSVTTSSDSVSFSATDNYGIVAYGYSNSAGVEQKVIYRAESSSLNSSFNLSAGTYQIWVEDAAGNRTTEVIVLDIARAMIGTTKYKTLQDAIDACAGSVEVPSQNSTKIDMIADDTTTG